MRFVVNQTHYRNCKPSANVIVGRELANLSENVTKRSPGGPN